MNPSSCPLSLFLTTTGSVFCFHPLGHEVAVLPYRERPWFSLQFPTTSDFRRSPALGKKSLAGAGRVRPGGENGPRCNLEPLPSKRSILCCLILVVSPLFKIARFHDRVHRVHLDPIELRWALDPLNLGGVLLDAPLCCWLCPVLR